MKDCRWCLDACLGRHTHTHAQLLNRHSRNINCVVVAAVFEHISSTRQIICRFRFAIEDDLAVSSVQAFRSGLPNYLRLWPTVLRLGETSAKHLLRLKRVPVLIPLGGHYTEAATGR